MRIQVAEEQTVQEILSLTKGLPASIGGIDTKIGANNSAASNVLTANQNAKLNWLLVNLATVNTNVTKKPALKQYSTGGRIAGVGSIDVSATASGVSHLTVTGSGRVLGAYTANTTFTIDNTYHYTVATGGFFNLPFNTSLRITANVPNIGMVLYELNI